MARLRPFPSALLLGAATVTGQPTLTSLEQIPLEYMYYQGTNPVGPFYPDDTPMVVTDTLTVQQSGATYNDYLTGATVTVAATSSNTELGELEFVDTAAISGLFAKSTGVLQLSGNATLAEYQAGLRSVVYRAPTMYKILDDPDVHTKNLTFAVVNSDSTRSNNVTRAVELSTAVRVCTDTRTCTVTVTDAAIEE